VTTALRAQLRALGEPESSIDYLIREVIEKDFVAANVDDLTTAPRPEITEK
jgi:hypothetical protein